MPKRVLILAATTGYQTRLCEETARRIGFEPVLATDRCHHLGDPWGDAAIAVRFEDPEGAATTLASLSPVPDGIVAVGDRPAGIAALTAERLGLRFHPAGAVAACRNKFIARERFRDAGLQVPEYYRVPLHIDMAEAVRMARFPCVLKPLGLSASRGVIRANNEAEFIEAFHRIRAILDQPELRAFSDEQDRFIQIETYIPGREFALEGLVSGGRLQVLAIFDKPDPLDGPFFEETIYVTPSGESDRVQRAIVETTEAAVAALSLKEGPAHAEMRVNDSGVWMLEVAARPIGGLCAGALRFEGGMPLEELLMRFAVGEDVSGARRETSASGVMMIPVPENGIHLGVEGVEEAANVPCISSVVITAKEGQRLRKLPEGASYPGFLFARAERPEEVEAALRLAWAKLRFTVAAELTTLR